MIYLRVGVVGAGAENATGSVIIVTMNDILMRIILGALAAVSTQPSDDGGFALGCLDPPRRCVVLEVLPLSMGRVLFQDHLNGINSIRSD